MTLTARWLFQLAASCLPFSPFSRPLHRLARSLPVLAALASLPASAQPPYRHCNHHFFIMPLERATIALRTAPFLEGNPTTKLAVVTEGICTRVRWQASPNGGEWVVIPGSRRVQWEVHVNEKPGLPEEPPMASITISKPN